MEIQIDEKDIQTKKNMLYIILEDPVRRKYKIYLAVAFIIRYIIKQFNWYQMQELKLCHNSYSQLHKFFKYQ